MKRFRTVLRYVPRYRTRIAYGFACLIAARVISLGPPRLIGLSLDEMAAAGIAIDVPKLEEELGIPVVATVATTGRGLNDLKRRLAKYVGNAPCAATI